MKNMLADRVIIGLSTIIAVPMLSSPSTVEARAVEKLRSNVVKLEATVKRGKLREPTIERGFGFIIGEKEDRIYIVTANHVVRGGAEPSPEDTTLSIIIWFYGDPQGYPAILHQQNSERLDLALVSGRVPEGLDWNNRCLGESELGNEDIWYIGRGDEWYISPKPLAIDAVNRVDFQLRLTGWDIESGSSGAPILSESGIVGMIVSETRNPRSYRGTSIVGVEAAVRDWDSFDEEIPWQLRTPKDKPGWWTAASVLSIAVYFSVAEIAETKWQDYESNPAHPDDLYSSYDNWNTGRMVVGAGMIAIAGWTTIQWIKYLRQ